MVMDEDMIPLITQVEDVYKSYYRDEMAKFWKKYHDFDKLVEFGVNRLLQL